jgi:hypothetical protein
MPIWFVLDGDDLVQRDGQLSLRVDVRLTPDRVIAESGVAD